MHVSQMHYFPLQPLVYAAFAGLLFVIFVLIQLNILRSVYLRLGLDPAAAMLALAGSLLGSYVNIPVAELPAERLRLHDAVDFFGMHYFAPTGAQWPGTVVAVNLGGAVIPVVLSLYLLARHGLWALGAVATIVVTLAVHSLATPVPGMGIAAPLIAPPLVAAATALILSRRYAAPLAYIAGSLGTLIGADLLNLDKLSGLGAPIASIGGAGTFDGIFLTGVIAVLIAALGAPRRPQEPPIHAPFTLGR